MAKKKEHWIKDALSPETKGDFSEKAKRAKKTVHQMAEDVKDNPKASTKTKQQANLALTLEKMRKRKGK